MRCAPVSPWSRSRSSCATPPPAATWPASCTAAARPGRSRASLAAAASGAVATEVEVPEMHTWPLVAALVGLLVGSAVGRWSAPQLLEALAATNLSRVNYRQRTVVAGLGIALAVGLLVWAGPLALVGELGSGSGWPARSGIAMSGAAVAAVLAGLGFTLLGLLDDLIQDQGHRGFRGHVQALARGRLTGGAVKLVGGAGRSGGRHLPAGPGGAGHARGRRRQRARRRRWRAAGHRPGVAAVGAGGGAARSPGRQRAGVLLARDRPEPLAPRGRPPRPPESRRITAQVTPNHAKPARALHGSVRRPW